MTDKQNGTKSKGKASVFWFAAPLAICLPCLLPLIAGALLTGVGVGAVGSFLSDNAILIAIAASLAVLFSLVIGWAVSRFRQRGGAVRSLSKDG